ncbi:hypothetical protein CM49_03387 [Paenibacillus sp. P1XP2]|nr:hypothetical protein CM49_03387 [Paenibacillus sp. P1XP2]
MATVITGLRPQDSLREPTTIMLNASTSVVSDSDRLAVTGEMPNSLENSGINGWV